MFQLSLAETEASIVTVLSSTSSLFTLFLAAFFPSNGGDKFSLSKLVAVTVSILGLVCKQKLKVYFVKIIYPNENVNI